MKNYSTNSFTRKCVVLWLAVAGLLSIIASGAAAAQSPHPVDLWIEECIAQDASTVGMVACLDEGYKRWDNELNYVYQELRGILTPRQQDVLKKSQRAWIAYRDAEFETINAIYGSLDGTLWRLAAMSAKVEMVKARTLELSTYLDSLREGL